MSEHERGLPNTVLFTIATEGYVPFVRNLHASLKRVGMGEQLVVYSLADRAQSELSDAGIRSLRYAADQCHQWSDYGTPGFMRTMWFKYAVALDVLKAGKNVLYVDSDIVFLRNPVDYLHRVITQSSAHVVAQFEFPKNVYNGGFWFATPARPVTELFSQIQSSLQHSELTCDQEVFNERLRQIEGLSVYALDHELFACGNQFLEGLPVDIVGIDRSAHPFAFDSAYILHFNYIVGKDAKVAAMMRHGALLDAGLARYGKRMKLGLRAGAYPGPCGKPAWMRHAAGLAREAWARLSSRFMTDLFDARQFAAGWPDWLRNGDVRIEARSGVARVTVNETLMHNVSVDHSVEYRYALEARSDTPNALVRLQINWHDAAGVFLEATIATRECGPRWTVYRQNMRPPAGATTGIVIVGGHTSTPVLVRRVSLRFPAKS
jgi:hypothetical protein